MESLYFIAILPSQEIREELQALKVQFKEEYQSKGSLNSPAHITLHMPFKLKLKKLESLNATLSEISKQTSVFNLKLKDFSCFEPRVIFVNVEENKNLEILQKELLNQMKRKLNIFNANYKERAFHPHITLAFRDLKKPEFYKAWNEFSEKRYEVDFEVNSLCLLKHNGKMWEEYRCYEFKKNL